MKDNVNQSGSGRSRGMTTGRRFVLALMVFLNVLILGLLCLLVTGHIDPPIP